MYSHVLLRSNSKGEIPAIWHCPKCGREGLSAKDLWTCPVEGSPGGDLITAIEEG